MDAQIKKSLNNSEDRSVQSQEAKVTITQCQSLKKKKKTDSELQCEYCAED